MTSKKHGDDNGPGEGNNSIGEQMQGRLRDLHEANLEDLLAQIYDAADDSFAQARQLGEDRDLQAEVFKQGATLAKTYGQLVAILDRHRSALKQER